MNYRRSLSMLCVLSIGVLLSACSQQAIQIPNVSLSQVQLNKYEASCKVCHEEKASGAPQRGAYQDWQIVFGKPMDLIMTRVIDGYAGMPPLGQCFDCSESDLNDLVLYLAQSPNTQKHEAEK